MGETEDKEPKQLHQGLRGVGRSCSRRPHLVSLIGFCALAFLAFSSTWISPGTRMIGYNGSVSGGDPVAYLGFLNGRFMLSAMGKICCSPPF